MNFKGVFVALNGCFNKDGEINLPAVKKLCRFYKNLGIEGLYICGSTGEGFLMNISERMKVLEAVMEEVGNEMTTIVHVGTPATHEAVLLARHSEKVGASATSAVPSVYYRLPEASIQRHWEEIINASSLPFFIYNIPVLTGYSLSMDLFNKMIKNKQVIGIKNSSEIAHDILRFKAAGGEDFIVLNGPDEQYLAGRLMGADGGIGGTYGCMPELYLKIEQYIVSGNIEKAKKLQNTITNLIYRLCSFPSMYGAAKTIIKMRGVDIGNPRLPFLPVSEDYPGLKELYNDIISAIESEKQ